MPTPNGNHKGIPEVFNRSQEKPIIISDKEPLYLKKGNITMKSLDPSNGKRNTHQKIGVKSINITNQRAALQKNDGPVINYAVKTRQGFIPG